MTKFLSAQDPRDPRHWERSSPPPALSSHAKRVRPDRPLSNLERDLLHFCDDKATKVRAGADYLSAQVEVTPLLEAAGYSPQERSRINTSLIFAASLGAQPRDEGVSTFVVLSMTFDHFKHRTFLARAAFLNQMKKALARDLNVKEKDAIEAAAIAHRKPENSPRKILEAAGFSGNDLTIAMQQIEQYYAAIQTAK